MAPEYAPVRSQLSPHTVNCPIRTVSLFDVRHACIIRAIGLCLRVWGGVWGVPGAIYTRSVVDLFYRPYLGTILAIRAWTWRLSGLPAPAS